MGAIAETERETQRVFLVDEPVEAGEHIVATAASLAKVGLVEVGGVGAIPGVTIQLAAVFELVSSVAVIDEEVDFVVAVIEVHIGVVLADVRAYNVVVRLRLQGIERHAATQRDHAVETGFFLFLEHYVEDTCHAVGVKTGRRVGDNLNAFNHGGGNLVQGKVGWTTIYPDGYILTAAHGHIAFHIHIH